MVAMTSLPKWASGPPHASVVGAATLVEVRPDTVAGRGLVGPGLVFAPAAQADGAVGKVLQAVVDVGPDGSGVEGRKGWLAHVVGIGLVPGGEHLPAPPGGRGQLVAGQRLDRVEDVWHDGLPAVQGGETARLGFLGQQERRSATGVANGEDPAEAKVIDHGDGVEGEAVPVVLTGGVLVRSAVAAQVEGEAMEPLAQM